MRIGELSESTGVPIPTIKFYLREGLLPPGERTHPNQALYTEAHRRRVTLIRALTEVGGLSVATARDVLRLLDVPHQHLHAVLGSAQAAMAEPAAAVDPEAEPARAAAVAAARNEVDDLLAGLGWFVDPRSPGRAALADVVVTLRGMRQEALESLLEPYARAALVCAQADLDAVQAAPDRDAKVETAVVGMVVGDAILQQLRRMAQEHTSYLRFLAPPRAAPATAAPLPRPTGEATP